MIFELLADMVKMGFIVFCLYAVFRAYMHWQQPARSMLLERRRLSIVSALVLVVLTLKVTEDVLGGESGPIDRAILVFVHGNVSTTLTAAFEFITLSGSAPVLVPLVCVSTMALLCAKRRYEPLLLVTSSLIGAALVYIVKTLVGRIARSCGRRLGTRAQASLVGTRSPSPRPRPLWRSCRSICGRQPIDGPSAPPSSGRS